MIEIFKTYIIYKVKYSFLCLYRSNSWTGSYVSPYIHSDVSIQSIDRDPIYLCQTFINKPIHVCTFSYSKGRYSLLLILILDPVLDKLCLNVPEYTPRLN